jgi:hypothetical protein
LADYCIEIAPDICAPCKGWHSNEGDGLNATDATALADALQREIDSGRTPAYVPKASKDLDRHMDALSAVYGGMHFTTGSGDKPGARFTAENVINFVAFLRASGGFHIR